MDGQSFNSSELNKLLEQHGVHKTWINLLASHISTNSAFNYILNSPEFKGAKPLKFDCLSGLSIGEIGVLYEYSVAYMDHDSRKSNGQFFTPDDVSKFMAQYSREFPKGIWLDPCSGVGNLSWHLVACQPDPEKFLLTNLVASDKDELALLIARTLLTVSFQKKEKKLFHKLQSKFIPFDFLSVADKGDLRIFDVDQGMNLIPKHDYVIMNPPYLAVRSDSRFETARSADLYAYFLENVIKSSEGFISITPQSFTNAAKFRELRQLLLSNYKNLTIFNFDNVPGNIFKGFKFGSQNSNTANSIRASIMIAQPGDGKRRISALIRWRAEQRDLLFTEVPKLLSDVPLTADFFPKVGKNFKSLYSITRKFPVLGDICVPKKTKYALYVPSAPRYFIPALLKPAKRSSQKTIYFATKEDRDRAYILINSSLMYWWWRVRDGGMTLSLETLLTLPIPNFRLSEKLIKGLAESEKQNKVYKQNAGALQENVKHPEKLLKKINELVMPKYAMSLLELHKNSDIIQINNT